MYRLLHGKIARFILAVLAGSLGQSLLASGDPEPPRYVNSIHCEPHAAGPGHWLALVDIVALAEEHDILLTLQFSPPWVEMITDSSIRLATVRMWQQDGHEISCHHHTIDHTESWDGYSDEPGAEKLEGYLGTLADYLAVLNQLPAPGTEIKTAASWAIDFPNVPFQTGGNDVPPIPSSARSQPKRIFIEDREVWMIQLAALIRGGEWYVPEVLAVFDAANTDDILGVAFHPNDYMTPADRAQVAAWFDALAVRDPDGTRSITAIQVLAPFERTPGDANFDGVIDGQDLALVLGSWGACTDDCPEACLIDFNGDCVIDGVDLAIALGSWTV